MKVCPNCGGKLIEDASEEITFTDDGGIIIDAFLANLCENECGYVERLDR